MRGDDLQEVVNRFKQNRATKRWLGRLWIRNLFRNYLRISEVHSCADLSTALPIILIGAGVSLEENIEHIRRVGETYCIVVVDTALPILRAHGIEPDLVVAMDSQIYNTRDFIDGIGQQTIVAMDLTAHPSLVRIAQQHQRRRHPQRSAFFSTQFADISLLRLLDAHGLRPLTIPALGSVGGAALYLSLMLTKREIYVVGLDFNYYMGKTHCRGAPFMMRAISTAHLLRPDPLYQFCATRAPLTIKDKNGSNSRSEPALMNSNSVLQELCNSYTRIYDCGNGGLYMSQQRARLSELPRATGGAATPYARQRATAATTARQRATAATTPPSPPRQHATKIAIRSRAITAEQRGATRTMITALQKQIGALLTLNPQEYRRLFRDLESRPPDEPRTAELDFLALDHDALPLPQHYRYSALDYHHRLTRYLDACS